MLLELLSLGLVCWVATLIVVESELFRPLRDLVGRPADTTGLRHYAAYLVRCHLCAGTWIGLALGLVVTPVVGTGPLGRLLTGLAIKAVAHLLLILQHIGERAYVPHKARPAARVASPWIASQDLGPSFRELTAPRGYRGEHVR